MPFISYRTRNFPDSLKVPACGLLSVSPEELIWGAVTVGATPIAIGGTPRPLLELCWRAAMAAANLEVGPSPLGWIKTAAYRRLDGSEKTAVSYFLGMMQAKITCAKLLGTPHLIHLDAYLTMIGKQQDNTSRPDLVGIDMQSMDCTLAVEAKGSSGRQAPAVVRRAKSQVVRLPEIVDTGKAVHVAS